MLSSQAFLLFYSRQESRTVNHKKRPLSVYEESENKSFRSDNPGPSNYFEDEEMNSLEPIQEDEPEETPVEIPTPSFNPAVNIDQKLAKLYKNNNYPTVTAILKPFYTSAFGIHQKSDEAMERGKEIHAYCEQYLKSKNGFTLVKHHQTLFDRLRLEMSKFDSVYSVESDVFSSAYKYRGRMDCLVYYRKKLTVVEFKTTKSKSLYSSIKDSAVVGALMQAAAYAQAFNELKLKDLIVNQVSVIIAADDSPKPIVYTGAVQKYFNLFLAEQLRFTENESRASGQIDEKKDIEMRTIKVTLNSIKIQNSLVSASFFKKIKELIVPFWTKLSFDGYNFAEFYVLYSLENKMAISLLDNSFFGKCLRMVTGGAMRGACGPEMLNVFTEFSNNLNLEYKDNLENTNERSGIKQCLDLLAKQMSANTYKMLDLLPKRYYKWIKLKRFEDANYKHFKAKDVKQLYSSPFYEKIDDEEKSEYQIVKEIYNKGMLKYKPLIDKAPNEDGIYNTYKDNVTKLNKIIQILHYINRDFVAHIEIDKDIKSTTKREKKEKSKKRPNTKFHLYQISKQALKEPNDLGIQKESKQIPKLKGIRRFSFLPIKSGFGQSYANISPTLVREMRTTANAFGNESFFIPITSQHADSRSRCNLVTVFSRYNNDLFNFNIKQLRPTFNKGFYVKSFSTDGVGCSILFERTPEGKKIVQKEKDEKKTALKTAKKAHQDAQKAEEKAFNEAIKAREKELKTTKKSRKNSDAKEPEVVTVIKNEKFQKKEFDETENLKAKLRLKPILGLDPGKKSLFTAYCVEENRMDKLFDDVIKLAESIQPMSDFSSNEIDKTEETKKYRRRRKKRKKKKWKKVKEAKKKHKTEAAVVPSDLPVPIDKLKNMECTFSYSSKK